MVIEYIPYGKNNAIPRRDLAALLSLDDRTMRDIIKRECIEQKVTVIGDHGYYRPLPTEVNEMRENITKNYNRAMEILTRNAIDKAVLEDVERGAIKDV